MIGVLQMTNRRDRAGRSRRCRTLRAAAAMAALLWAAAVGSAAERAARLPDNVRAEFDLPYTATTNASICTCP